MQLVNFANIEICWQKMSRDDCNPLASPIDLVSGDHDNFSSTKTVQP